MCKQLVKLCEISHTKLSWGWKIADSATLKHLANLSGLRWIVVVKRKSLKNQNVSILFSSERLFVSKFPLFTKQSKMYRCLKWKQNISSDPKRNVFLLFRCAENFQKIKIGLGLIWILSTWFFGIAREPKICYSPSLYWLVYFVNTEWEPNGNQMCQSSFWIVSWLCKEQRTQQTMGETW